MRFGIGTAAMLGSLLLTAGAVAACGAPGTAEDGRPGVVATTTQVGSIAAEIGGDAIDLTVLLEPGVEAHDFELTPAKGAALERADLVLISGAGLESWLDDALGDAGRVRDMSEGVALREPTVDEPPHGDDGDDGDDGDHSDADGHGDHDPHYWLSGPNAMVMVANARTALVEVAPDAADEIAARADALIARIEAADAEVRSLIGEVPEDERKVVTDHDALGYFIEEYGLEFVGSAFPSMDVSSEPSARDVERLIADIRAAGVPAIFTESSVNPRLARAIAGEAGARLVSDPIYTDSLGEDGSGAETLDAMLVHNARVIRDGLLGG